MKSLLLLFLLISSSNIFGDDPPIEWGEISVDDLKLQSFAGDANASALILCDYGETFVDNQLYLNYTRHLRVKIFSTKGYDWGTHSVVLYTEDGIERFDDLEAVTYTLDNDDDIIETEFDDDDLIEEKIDDQRTRFKFTLPGLQPNCIIEIRYTIISQYLSEVKDWVFQHEEPVVWSEYRLRFPKAIAFSAVTLGYEPWFVRETNDATQIFNGNAAAYLGKNIITCTQYRWVIQNAPAIRDEPFITSTRDYVNKVDIQLAGYAFPGGGKKQFLHNWNAFIEEMLEDGYLSKNIDVSNTVEKLEKELTSGLTAPQDKIIKIYDWVASSIVWSDEQRVYPKLDVDDVIELKKGNSADITFLLLSLLKSAGINGDPVILSTRKNGRIQELYPIAHQFNYVIAKINVGTKVYYLDATDPMRPYDLLPFKVLNVKGLIIKSGAPQWITFSSDKKNNINLFSQIQLNDDGYVSGTFEHLYNDYKSLNLRDDFKNKSEIDAVKNIFDIEASGFEIDSFLISNKDSVYNPLLVKSWINSSSYAQTTGDIIYVNPFFGHNIKENPFKAAARKFPIDYAHKSSVTWISNITLPENYEVKEMPANKTFNVSNGISFSRQIAVNEKQIQLLSKLEIKEIVFNNNLYEKLKNFYAMLISAQAEQIVLTLKTDDTATINNEIEQ